jgi:two-component system osmolarity sensor histidine kinase EnvZ
MRVEPFCGFDFANLHTIQFSIAYLFRFEKYKTENLVTYSLRNASTGGIFEALYAGYTPNTIPTATENPSSFKKSHGETETATPENLIRDIDRMTEMVNGYLAFARGETPEIEQATELPPMLIRIARDAAGTKEIITDFPETPTQFYARPMALARAFSNIIENAARYAKSAIRITETDAPDSVTITIEDDGIGIPDNRKRDAMRPFVRLDDARGTNTGGTGLGLSIAQTAIENHGGQIFLEDSDMGGLRVRIILPI